MSSQQRHSAGLLEIMGSFWRNRSLIWQMSRRDVIGRYRGSIFGLAWSFFNPLLMLITYTFVFSVVFKARWGGVSDESRTDFAIILFAGMIVYSLFAECVNRAPGLILSNVNYVKKVLFPLEILPWVALCSALFHAFISLMTLLLVQLILRQQLPWTVIFFPLVILPLLLGTLGFAWFLAALGVYMRDIGQATGIFTSVLMFLSPLFYPVSALPPPYQGWLLVNPLTFIMESGRKTLIFGQIPDWSAWIAYLGFSGIIAWIGFWWFQKTRKGFADVL